MLSTMLGSLCMTENMVSKRQPSRKIIDKIIARKATKAFIYGFGRQIRTKLSNVTIGI